MKAWTCGRIFNQLVKAKIPGKSSLLRLIVHLGALIPISLLLYDYRIDNLTANPIQEITFRTGKTTLVMLCLTLACSPIYSFLKYRPALNMRRTLGLYTFFYVSLHFLTFVVLDYGLNLGLIYEAIFEKPYALVGFSAFLILLPMAVTSTKGWQRRLGKNWKRLHRWIYAAGGLAVVHYSWAVKSDIREPIAYGIVVALLLLLRVPRVKKATHALFDRMRTGQPPALARVATK